MDGLNAYKYKNLWTMNKKMFNMINFEKYQSVIDKFKLYIFNGNLTEIIEFKKGQYKTIKDLKFFLKKKLKLKLTKNETVKLIYKSRILDDYENLNYLFPE